MKYTASESAQLLWKCDVASPTELLLVRIRARQITRLLGFDRNEQALVASVLFELLAADWNTRVVEVVFFLETNYLRVYRRSSSNGNSESHRLRVESQVRNSDKLLVSREAPSQQRQIDAADFPWMLNQLSENALFEELRAQNLEFLELFLDSKPVSVPSFSDNQVSLNSRAA